MDTEKKNLLNALLDHAYADLTAYATAQSDAQQRYEDAKSAFELAKAAKYISGEIQGKNDTERKSSEATLLADHIGLVKSAERNMQLVGLSFRLAEIEAERVRWKIRLELGPVIEQ